MNVFHDISRCKKTADSHILQHNITMAGLLDLGPKCAKLEFGILGFFLGFRIEFTSRSFVLLCILCTTMACSGTARTSEKPLK